MSFPRPGLNLHARSVAPRGAGAVFFALALSGCVGGHVCLLSSSGGDAVDLAPPEISGQASKMASNGGGDVLTCTIAPAAPSE